VRVTHPWRVGGLTTKTALSDPLAHAPLPPSDHADAPPAADQPPRPLACPRLCASVQEALAAAEKRDPGQPEFMQAVHEVRTHSKNPCLRRPLTAAAARTPLLRRGMRSQHL
jgi:hypothetical protein